VSFVQFIDLQDISSRKGIDINKLEFSRTGLLTHLSLITHIQLHIHQGIFSRLGFGPWPPQANRVPDQL